MGDPGISEDGLFGGRVRLRQPRAGHRAGTDAVLLAGLSGAQAGEQVLDLGSASGAVALMIAARVPDIRLTLVERQPDLAELAHENLRLNGHADTARVVALDVFSSPASWPSGLAGWADLVVTNPPFFESQAEMRASPDTGRRGAHVMSGGGFAEWAASAARLAKPRGRIAVIQRADALPLVLSGLSPRFGSLIVRPVHARAHESATRILVHGRKGGRAPLAILPPLVLHEQDGSFTPEAAALHGKAGPGGGLVSAEAD
jgi:tRNA1(Val) A37 N6-methylase TrmN6